MKWPVTKLTYRTHAGRETSGERPNRKRGVASFELPASLFAGDYATFPETGKDVVTGTPCLFGHLGNFGLEMDVGSSTTAVGQNMGNLRCRP